MIPEDQTFRLKRGTHILLRIQFIEHRSRKRRGARGSCISSRGNQPQLPMRKGHSNIKLFAKLRWKTNFPRLKAWRRS